MSCMVPGCSSNPSKDASIEFFLFPKCLEICQLWVEACQLGNAEINVDEDVICSLHFEEDAFDLEAQKEDDDDDDLFFFTRKLKEEAIPTVNLPENNINQESKIVVVNHDLESYSIDDAQDSSSQDAIKESSNQPIKNTFSDLHKHKKYDMIRTKAQLSDMKEANERLQKQIAALEKEFITEANIHKNKLIEYNEIRNNLKKYAKHVLSEQQTKSILSKVFSPTQIKVLLGKKKTYWSDHDMAVAYTIRHLSNISCYNYLMKNMNIPLPGLSSIKRWINVKNLGKKRPAKKTTETKGDTGDVMKSEDFDANMEENEQLSEQNDMCVESNEDMMEEMIDEME